MKIIHTESKVLDFWYDNRAFLAETDLLVLLSNADRVVLQEPIRHQIGGSAAKATSLVKTMIQMGKTNQVIFREKFRSLNFQLV